MIVIFFQSRSWNTSEATMSLQANWKLVLVSSWLAIGISASAAEPPGKPEADGAAKPASKGTSAGKKSAARLRPHFTLSKQTTYITEPLRADGYPDYVAALNQMLSKGVTPENNAAVPFWQAMGPAEISKGARERFFQLLGIPPLPEQGDYFVTSNQWVAAHKSKPDSDVPTEEESRVLYEQMDTAMKRPWTRDEFPLWAQWLDANEKRMPLLIEACRRPRRYEPLTNSGSGREMVIGCLLTGAQQSRELARALTLRAMYRLGQGKVDEAWSDLLDCHRLGRLSGQGATLVDGLVALTIDSIADAGDRALLRHAKLDAGQIAKMRADLDALAPLPRMVDKIDTAERFMFLDCTLLVAEGGLSEVMALTSGAPAATQKSLLDSLVRTSVDWDVPLRVGNSWYDRLVAAGRLPTYAERKKAANKIDEDIKAMAKSAKDPATLALSLLAAPREAVSERIGQVLVALLLPAVQAAEQAEDRINMQLTVTKLGFALAAYRVDHNSYPPALADLVPKYVKELPKDVFNNDKDLHYGHEGDGYLLYSVGVNGKDDGGRGYDDRKNNEDWDDLSVRIVSPARP
jgi:hypothetical protein